MPDMPAQRNATIMQARDDACFSPAAAAVFRLACCCQRTRHATAEVVVV